MSTRTTGASAAGTTTGTSAAATTDVPRAAAAVEAAEGADDTSPATGMMRPADAGMNTRRAGAWAADAAAAARAMTSETDPPHANATTIEDTTTYHNTTTGHSSWARNPAAGTRRGEDGETENENAAGEVDRQRAAGTNAAAGEDTAEAATATSTTLAIEARPATDANGTTTATAGTKDESPRGENPRE